MSDRATPTRRVAPPVRGIGHVFAATGYSLAGLRRLLGETAFRHEVVALIGTAVLFFMVGAGLVELAALLGLFLLLFAVEALNTAVECIVDRVSPEWSEIARDAKDLGSFAVMCIVAILAVYICAVVAGHL